MTNIMKKLGLGVALAASALAIYAPAQAHDYHGYRNDSAYADRYDYRDGRHREDYRGHSRYYGNDRYYRGHHDRFDWRDHGDRREGDRPRY